MLNIFKRSLEQRGLRTALAMHQAPPLVFLPLWIILFSGSSGNEEYSAEVKVTHRANYKAINNIYVFAQINLQTPLILKEFSNNAQELITRNSTRWHKSMDISFHTEPQKYLRRLNQSLAQNCKESWQFLIVSWLAATQWALYIHGVRSSV